jgi:hypothetical protein
MVATKKRRERFLTSRSDGPKGGCQGWWPQKKPLSRLFFRLPGASALACLETWITLADHEQLAAATHDLAVTVTCLGGFQRAEHLHGGLQGLNEDKGLDQDKSVILAMLRPLHKPLPGIGPWQAGLFLFHTHAGLP